MAGGIFPGHIPSCSFQHRVNGPEKQLFILNDTQEHDCEPDEEFTAIVLKLAMKMYQLSYCTDLVFEYTYLTFSDRKSVV